jgi:hypothetical protein
LGEVREREREREREMEGKAEKGRDLSREKEGVCV